MKPRFLNNLLLALSLCTAIPCFAEDVQSTPSQDPNAVSDLLKKLKIANPADTNKIPAPKPKPKPTPKPKLQPKPIIIAPKPVEISAPVPSEAQVPVVKRSLPDFVHNIYIRADYGVGMPNKVQALPNSLPTDPNIRFEKSFMYGVGLGYKFNQAFRSDINLQYRILKQKTKGSLRLLNKVQSSSVFVNNYLFLMDSESNIAPFIMAGVGYAHNKVKDINFKGTFSGAAVMVNSKGEADHFVWNIGGGASFRLTKNLHIEASYKFIDIGKLSAYNTVSTSTSSIVKVPLMNKRIYIHEISGGLVINF